MTTTKTKSAADETAKAGGGAKEIATDVSGRAGGGEREAYIGGIVGTSRTLGGFGREVFTEAGQHVATLEGEKACALSGSCRPPLRSTASRCRRPMLKEFADLARAKSEEVIAPIARSSSRTLPPDQAECTARRDGGPDPHAALNASEGSRIKGRLWLRKRTTLDQDLRRQCAARDRADAILHRRALRRRRCALSGQPAFECFGRTMTYAQRSTALRAPSPPGCEKKLGVKRGDRVALMCPNVFAFPIAMLGIHRAWGSEVNVNPLYTPRGSPTSSTTPASRRSSSSAARPRPWPRSSTRPR